MDGDLWKGGTMLFITSKNIYSCKEPIKPIRITDTDNKNWCIVITFDQGNSVSMVVQVFKTATTQHEY